MPTTIASKVDYARYLEIERETNTKHEYRSGEVVAFAGGTMNHSRLATTFMKLLFLAEARGEHECDLLNSDHKLYIPTLDFVCYPV